MVTNKLHVINSGHAELRSTVGRQGNQESTVNTQFCVCIANGILSTWSPLLTFITTYVLELSWILWNIVDVLNGLKNPFQQCIHFTSFMRSVPNRSDP